MRAGECPAPPSLGPGSQATTEEQVSGHTQAHALSHLGPQDHTVAVEERGTELPAQITDQDSHRSQ